MYAILVFLNLFQPCHDAARAVRGTAAKLYSLSGRFTSDSKSELQDAQSDLRDGKTKWRDGTDLKDAIDAFQNEYESWCMTAVILNRVTALLNDAFPEPPKGKD